MKTRKGLPTKTEIVKLAESIGFRHNQLDSYSTYSPGYVMYSGNQMIARAGLFAQAIRDSGFQVEHRPYASDLCRCGVVRISPKEAA